MIQQLGFFVSGWIIAALTIYLAAWLDVHVLHRPKIIVEDSFIGYIIMCARELLFVGGPGFL